MKIVLIGCGDRLWEMSDWRHRWLTSAGLDLSLLTEMEYIAGQAILGRKVVNFILKYMGHLNGGLQLMVGDKDFVVSEEVWDKILGDLSAF